MRKSKSVIGIAAGMLLVGATITPAIAAPGEPSEPCDGLAVCTDSFAVTGAPEMWTVPYGITSISVNVAGGAGGSYFSSGGAGGTVSTTIPVTPGQELAFVVGGAGGVSHDSGAGGYGGGAGSHGPGYGGGGGGGSFVFVEDGGAWDLLVAAGGGGGGGRDQSDPDTAGGAGFGGSGGFATGSADAEPADGDHAAGATTTASGYAGGTPAAFDGAAFVPGSGEVGANTAGRGSGGGGGGYFGGAGAQLSYRGGGGGSGYLAPGLVAAATGVNLGNGSIDVTYANLNTTLTVSAASTTIELGDSVDLTGTIRQFDAAGGTGYVAFWTTIDGVPTVIDAESVVTSGTGPFEGSATRAFTPTSTGTYVITADFQSDDGLHEWADSSNSVTIEVTEPVVVQPPQSPTPPKRIETGAR